MNAVTIRTHDSRSFRSRYRTRYVIPRMESVSRSELVGRVERAAQRKLVLLTAPAGWGKTALLTEWAAQTSHSVIWISFEARDAEPLRFLRMIAEAVDGSHLGAMDDVLPLLLVPHIADAGRVLSDLLDALSGIHGEIALVFDDPPFEGEEIGLLLDGLLRDLPTNVHLLMSSRAEFPVPVARLRMRGDVVEFGMHDLRFTLEETARFWDAFPEIQHSPDDVARSLAITEGWAAGLSLAAMAVAPGRSPRGVLENFGGTHRDVSAYLTEEVFATLPPDVQDFLVRTALLDVFSAALCDHVLGRHDSTDVFRTLESCNPFLIPVDGEGRWYRYHTMFADYLRSRLAALGTSEIAVLNRRAGVWYEREGCIDDAIDHFLKADAYDDAVRVLDVISRRPVVTADETASFARWAARIPAELLGTYPSALRFHARALTLMGRLDEARGLVRLLRQVANELSDNGKRELEAETLAIESRIGAYLGDDASTVESVQCALSLIGEENPGLRADLLLSLGFIHRGRGDLRTSTALFGEASQLGRVAHAPQAELWGIRYLAVDWIAQGRLADAMALINDELDRLHDVGSFRDFARAALLVGRAETEYERNDLDAAQTSIDEAFAIAQVAGDAKILMNTYVAQMHVDLAVRDRNAALRAILRAQRLLNGRQEVALHAAILLDTGNLAAARQWADGSGLTLADPLLLDRGSAEQVTFARIRFETGAREDAVALLERLRAAVEDRGWVKRTIEMRSQLAVFHDRLGNATRACEEITAAIRHAAPGRYMRSILDGGEGIELLVRESLRRGGSVLSSAERDFALDLVRGSVRSDVDAVTSSVVPLVEPLSQRQVQILRLLVSGHSNREIAEELFVAEGTVKAHVHQLYGKLMARNRIEAIARARQLGLAAN